MTEKWCPSTILLLLVLVEVGRQTAAIGETGLVVRVGLAGAKLTVRANRVLPGPHHWLPGDRLVLLKDPSQDHLQDFFWSSDLPGDAVSSTPAVACITLQLAYNVTEVPPDLYAAYLRRDAAGELRLYTLGPQVFTVGSQLSNPACPGAEYRGVEPEWWWCRDVQCPSRQSRGVQLPDGSTIEVEDPPGTCVQQPDGPGNCCVFNHGWANPLHCNAADSLFELFECFRLPTLRGRNPVGQTAVCPSLAAVPFGNFSLVSEQSVQDVCSDACVASLRGGLGCFQDLLSQYSRPLTTLKEPLTGVQDYLAFCTRQGYNHTLLDLGVRLARDEALGDGGDARNSTGGSGRLSTASSDEGLSVGASLGVAIAVMVCVGLIGGGFYVLYVRRTNLQRSRALADFSRQFERPVYTQL